MGRRAREAVAAWLQLCEPRQIFSEPKLNHRIVLPHFLLDISLSTVYVGRHGFESLLFLFSIFTEFQRIV